MDIPIGIDAAEQDVQITVEPLPPTTTLGQEEWAAWVDAMAGNWKANLFVLLSRRANDMMIAAIALGNRCTLITHNTNEFSRVPGLTIEDWQIP